MYPRRDTYAPLEQPVEGGRTRVRSAACRE